MSEVILSVVVDVLGAIAVALVSALVQRWRRPLAPTS